MQIVRTREELAAALRVAERPIGLVPTMGALHSGHAALIAAARAASGTVVVSIYVNPRQFASGTDVAAYPRDLDADAALARTAGADLIFAPDDATIYPPGETPPAIDPGPLAVRLEGAARPGHFAGVATVVTILFDLVSPDAAWFGEKDAQQLRVVEALAQRRGGPAIYRVPTVRDADGLALSSRNVRLTPSGRATALAIPRALQAATSAHASGSTTAGEIRAAALAELRKGPALDLDYLDIAESATLAPIPDEAPLTTAVSGELLITIAAVVDGVRLIDACTLPVAN